jgi:hypothetical protein
VTAVSTHQAGPPPGLRLLLLHLISRRVPAAVAVLAACGVLLRLGLQWHWITGNGPQAAELPVMIEGAAAAVIAVVTASPFGEPERATGRWLPYLRLADALGLTLAAVAILAAGAAAAGLPGGTLAIARNVAGLAGLGLLSSAVLGGLLAWIGPMAYAVVAEFAIIEAWTTPWMWPARPPHDWGAALCAGVAFAAGLLVAALRGARDPAHE